MLASGRDEGVGDSEGAFPLAGDGGADCTHSVVLWATQICQVVRRVTETGHVMTDNLTKHVSCIDLEGVDKCGWMNLGGGGWGLGRGLGLRLKLRLGEGGGGEQVSMYASSRQSMAIKRH